MIPPSESRVDEMEADSFPCSDPPSYAMGTERPPALGPVPQGGPTRPPEAPLDQVIATAFKHVEPPGFRDNPRSAIEAADVDVQDTIGGE